VAERALHIGVDARELGGQTTGVGRYLLEVLRQWTTHPAWPHQITLFVPQPPAPATVEWLGSRVRWQTVAGAEGTIWEQRVLPRALADARVDVLFAAGYTAPLWSPCPFVVAIYDVSYAAHPEWFGWREGLRRRWLSKRAARRAATVVTISEFSAGEIARYFGVGRDRIVIAPPGAPPRADAAEAPRERIVLYAGSIFNRREIPLLVEAFADVTSRVCDARLILAGANRSSPRVDPIAEARLAGVADRVEWREYVSDRELAALYDRASVFAFLSTYEGFAMTPLEAIAHGVPAVLLDTAVAREVYGNGARLVDRDVHAVAAALEALLTDAAAHAAQLGAGLPLLDRYSWTTAAATIRAALERAVPQ
jgi:glycosyltransferase involved in cell wall biosynthesis